MKTLPNDLIGKIESSISISGRTIKHYSGLTKREHFAGLAMQGLLSIYDGSIIVPSSDNMKYMAGLSVTAADALIEELNKTER